MIFLMSELRERLLSSMTWMPTRVLQHDVKITRVCCHYKIKPTYSMESGGGWTMRSEIINAPLSKEAATQMTTMEKWIGYEEGSLIPRGRETSDKIKGSKL